MICQYLASALLAAVGLLALRVLWLMFGQKRPLTPGSGPVKTMIVLGSGGHTAEMLALVRRLDRAHYAPRVYVAAATDRMSGQKALALEADWAGADAAAAAAGAGGSGSGDKTSGSSGGGPKKQQQRQQRGGASSAAAASAAAAAAAAAAPARVVEIPRSREVGQSYATSVGTTLYSLAFAAWAVARERPRMLLVNGPGTCIPVCGAAFVLRALGLLDARIAYVESIARVERLSLSGALLRGLRMADLVLVQWPEMAARYPRTVCAGRLY